MKQQILVSLILLTPALAHSMENESSSNIFSSLSTYVSEWLQPSDKSKFREQLQLSAAAKRSKWLAPVTVQLFWADSIDANPTLFLQYCYYQKYHADEFWNIDAFKNNPELLKKCQEARIDGYSALGAAMIAKDVSAEEQNKFIQQLLDLGFQSTPQDATLGIETLT